MATIFIIEDEIELAREWAMALEAEGYETTVLSSVSDVLGRLDDVASSGMVVLDIMMPTLDALEGVLPEDDLMQMKYGREAGVWMCRKLRQRNPTLPIVIATVVEDSEILRAARAAGASQILAKPFGNEVLIQAVERALGAGGSGDLGGGDHG